MGLIETAVDPVVPLRYFAEEAAHRDSQATEALFLTFNADLPFLESRLLDLCRQAGARVTVVADASVWSPDVRSITRAGVRYHLGLVAARAAFHPKVSVLAGPDRAIAIVGSGNLGMAGWQSNAEIATVISATREVAPVAMRDLRGVLDTLALRAEVDPASAEAISRASDQLAELLADAEIVDTGHRIAASWDGPLVDRLPSQPVDELLLTAAFHDMESAAVAHLLQRLQPSRVRVAIQPRRTVIDPAALDRVLSEYASSTGADCAVVVDRESRYRHGKLIEWTVEGVRSSLTGSPNLSGGALISAAPKGNFEVAVLGPTPHTLFPEGDLAENPSELPARSGFVAGDTEGRVGPMVVAAVLSRDVLSLRIARASTDADVEISGYANPDSWMTLTRVPATHPTIELAGEFRGGDRVRLAWIDSNGARRLSAPVFVTDRDAVLVRPIDRAHVPRIKQAIPSDLWSDDLSFLESVLDELRGLTQQAAERMPPSTNHTGQVASATEKAPSEREADSWLWLRDEAVETLGPGIGPYALGLPPLTSTATSPTPDWTDAGDLLPESDLDLEVDRGDGDTDQDDGRDGAEEPSESPTDHTQSPPWLRKKRQRWCSDAADVAPVLDVQYRLLVLRITLRLWHLGNWDDNDTSPLRIIARMTSSLAAPNPPGRPEPPAELTSRVNSLATVAVTLLQPNVNRPDEEKRDIYRALRTNAASLISASSDERLEEDFQGLIGLGEMESAIYDAQRLMEDVMSGDELGELERRLHLKDTTKLVSRPAINLLHLVADVPKVRVERLALELLGEVEEHSGVGVWVSNLDGEWSLAAWDAPALVRVTAYPNGRLRWRYHRLSPVTTPSSIAGEEFRGQKPELGRPQPEHEAVAILREMGIIDPHPPTYT